MEGKGLSLPTEFFAFNNEGTGGVFDLEEGYGYGEGWPDHDCGYHPDWVEETREYLEDLLIQMSMLLCGSGVFR